MSFPYHWGAEEEKRKLERQLADAIAGREADAVEYRRRAAMAAEGLAVAWADCDGWKKAYEIEYREKFAALQRENEREVERDAAIAEVARLRAAIEPMAATRREYVEAIERALPAEDTEDAIVLMDELLYAIRARAGEVSAPGSSLRERVDETLIELERDQMEAARNDDFALSRGIAHAIHNVRAALGEP